MHNVYVDVILNAVKRASVWNDNQTHTRFRNRWKIHKNHELIFILK